MKNLNNIGKALSKAEQQIINGGKLKDCEVSSDCGAGEYCSSFSGECTKILLGSN